MFWFDMNMQKSCWFIRMWLHSSNLSRNCLSAIRVVHISTTHTTSTASNLFNKWNGSTDQQMTSNTFLILRFSSHWTQKYTKPEAEFMNRKRGKNNNNILISSNWVSSYWFQYWFKLLKSSKPQNEINCIEMSLLRVKRGIFHFQNKKEYSDWNFSCTLITNLSRENVCFSPEWWN